MKHLHHTFVFMLLLIAASLTQSGFAQVGINNPNPDSSALLDLKSYDKGILIPRMTTIDRTNMTVGGKTPAHALLVFDVNQNMFFVYDTITNPDRWVAMNPFQTSSSTGDITTPITGNVGIGTYTPTQRLEVNGSIKALNNLMANGNVMANGNITAANGTFTGNVTTTGVSTSSINATGTVTAASFAGNGVIPIGGIIMWSGTPGTIPAGWKLCDGTTGTPNLANRFIMSYGSTSGPVGTTGGQNNVTLTIANLPPHKHNVSDRYASENDVASGGTRRRASDYHHDIIETTDGSEHGLASQPFDNRPAYYVMAYIMRIQ